MRVWTGYPIKVVSSPHLANAFVVNQCYSGKIMTITCEMKSDRGQSLTSLLHPSAIAEGEATVGAPGTLAET